MIDDVNPFIYSHPVAPEDIIDRDEETRELLKAAVGGHYVRLYGPRKYGKTSLLRRVLLEADREQGMIPILVDLYGVLSITDVAIRFERAYAKQLKGKVRARVEEFLQSTGLGLSLGALGISARLQLDPRADPLPALHALLDLPLRLEDSGGFRALIVLDEFQDVTKVRELDALLRSHIQFQGDVASFIFAGSEPGLMRELFEEVDANWRRLATNAQKALRAVVAGDGSPFQRRVLEQLDLRKSTARAALQTLVGNATVEQEDDTYVLVDPLFAEWIANLRETAGDELSRSLLAQETP